MMRELSADRADFAISEPPDSSRRRLTADLGGKAMTDEFVDALLTQMNSPT